MIDGCLDSPKTSAPNRNTRVATYWFAPLIRLTTAITADTPMTTPISVSMLRSLCAHRLEVEMATASEKFMVLRDRAEVAVPCKPGWFGLCAVGSGIGFCGDTTAAHPNIRAAGHWNYALSGGKSGEILVSALSLVADALGQRPGALPGNVHKLRVFGDLLQHGQQALGFRKEAAVQIRFELQQGIVDAQPVVLHAAGYQVCVFLLPRQAFKNLQELRCRGIHAVIEFRFMDFTTA